MDRGRERALHRERHQAIVRDREAVARCEGIRVAKVRLVGGVRRAKIQAIGRSRGGRTTKIHALTDTQGRPYVLVLTPGNIADITAAPALLTAMPLRARLIADKGYDADSLRRRLAASGTQAVIPSTASRHIP